MLLVAFVGDKKTVLSLDEVEKASAPENGDKAQHATTVAAITLWLLDVNFIFAIIPDKYCDCNLRRICIFDHGCSFIMLSQCFRNKKQCAHVGILLCHTNMLWRRTHEVQTFGEKFLFTKQKPPCPRLRHREHYLALTKRDRNFDSCGNM